MATRMQQRRGTATQWTTANPILNVAEIGYETDTNKFKIGDGTNHWADLNYFVDGAELSNIIDGAPALLDTLNELAAAIGDDPAFFTTVATNLSNHESDTTNVHGIANTADLATQSYVDTAVGNIDLSTKQDVVSGVSSTEIGYLDGVTSSIQTQLNTKASLSGTETLSNKTLSNPVVSQSGDVTVLTYTGGFYAYGENGTRFMMFTNLGLDSEITSDLVGTYVTIASGVWAGTHLITGYLPQNPVWSNQVYPVLYFPGGGNYDTPQSASLTFVESVTATISAVEISYLDGVTSGIQGQLNAKASATDLSNHSSDTTSVHGIADTSLLVTTTGTQTLSNKTLESPTVTVSAGVSFSMNTGYLDSDGSSGTAYTFYNDQPGFSDFYTYFLSLGVSNGSATGPITITGVTSGGYISGTNTVTMQDMGNSIFIAWPSIAYQSGATFTSPTIGWGGSTVTVSATEISYLDGVTSAIQTQLDSKLESSDLSGYATETYVGTQISNLVDSAPTALNTLNELAAALGDDANYAATITTALGAKAPLEDPTFTGTVDLSGATVVGLPAAGPTAVEIVMGVY